MSIILGNILQNLHPKRHFAIKKELFLLTRVTDMVADYVNVKTGEITSSRDLENLESEIRRSGQLFSD